VSDAALFHAAGLLARGDFAAAARGFADIAASSPSPGKAYAGLGHALLGTGKAKAAAASFQRAINAGVRDPSTLEGAGRAFLAAGVPEVAKTHFQKLEASGDASADVLYLLSQIMISNEREGEALLLLEAALAKDPVHARALCSYGIRLQQRNKLNDATSAFQRAIAANPLLVLAHVSLGSALEDLGDREGARQKYRDALEISPDDANALARLIGLSGDVAEIELVQLASRKSRDESVAPAERSRLHFALAKLDDRDDRTDDAFTHLQEANRLQQVQSGSFDQQAFARWVDDIIGLFDRSFIEANQPHGDLAFAPIFVVGMPRSGTTLAEQILSMHTDVSAAGEQPFLTSLAKQPRAGELSFFAWLRQLGPDDWRRIAAGYRRSIDSFLGKGARLVDKMPLNFLYVGLAAILFPRARFVHCRRHPMDNGLSCYRENFNARSSFANDLASIGAFIRQHDRLLDHWQIAAPDPPHVVQYEDMVADPETRIRDLVAACGLDWQDRCLDFWQADRAVNTPSRWQVRQPIYRSAAGRWKRYEKHLAPLRAALEES
jgi:tetratricopeptide (TPR) repeat protein